MPRSRSRPGHRLCLHCYRVLTADDRDHYVYQCHACVVVEHDSSLLAHADPDHPDTRRLGESPVAIAIRRREG